MVPKIDLAKVVGSDNVEEKESQSFLPQSVSSPKASWWSTWQTPVPRPLRSPQALWAFVTIALLIQALICWRLFFPPGPEYAISPSYNVSETVSLITEYYRLLQDLRYLGRHSIAYPPHTGIHAINLTLCHELGLPPSAIETLQQLPYITPHEDQLNSTGGYLTESELENLHKDDDDWYPGWMPHSRDTLWRNGHFMDYRDDTQLWRSRDPLQRYRLNSSPWFSFEDNMIKYEALPKSALPLSFLRRRKYGLCLVLDTADGRLVVLDSQGYGNKDPFIKNLEWEHIPTEYRISTKFYHHEVYARLANGFLKELIMRTAQLDVEYVPGSVRPDDRYTPELSPPRWELWVRELYEKYGWHRDYTRACRYGNIFGRPENCDKDPLELFNGTGFDAAMKELRHKIQVQYMPDWYTPVPRNQRMIDSWKRWGLLTEEQIEFAESDEPQIAPQYDGSWKSHPWYQD